MEQYRANRLVQVHGPSEFYPHTPKDSPMAILFQGLYAEGKRAPARGLVSPHRAFPPDGVAQPDCAQLQWHRLRERWRNSCWLLFCGCSQGSTPPPWGTWPSPLVSHSPCKSWGAMRGRLDPVKPFFLWEGSWGSKIKRLTQDDFFSGKAGSKRRVPWHLSTKCFSIL